MKRSSAPSLAQHKKKFRVAASSSHSQNGSDVHDVAASSCTDIQAVPPPSSSHQQSTCRPLQFKCPLGHAQLSRRGTLGLKKQYAGFDILSAFQKTVVLQDPNSANPLANGLSDLVLYDPAEHRPPAAATTDEKPSSEPSADPSSTDPVTSALKDHVKVFADSFLVQKLRPHQREGVKFVFECLSGVSKEGFTGAVLCDGMGLGKTFQTIASLWCLLTKGIKGEPTCKKPLILCPSSLVQNWGRELLHWLGDRVLPVVVDDTKASAVKDSLQASGCVHASSNAGCLICDVHDVCVLAASAIQPCAITLCTTAVPAFKWSMLVLHLHFE